ncbi:MAG: phosphatidic acid phosphatase [Lachnospiraceae bacterium]|nr:phosphatidic acid phosphatase [Lachnospiraceae bacterium]
MKKQLYDYRGFSLKKLTDPRFSHILLLGGWIGYFSLYFITENLIPIEKCHLIHCALDDIIPFNDFFIIFYVGWYALVFGSLAYTLFFDVPRFRKLQIFIMITQAVAMACYIIYPSYQNLRPEVFPRGNLLTMVMGAIYAFDTPTGICPSLHIAYSLGIVSVGLKDRRLPAILKVLLVFVVIMISLAVCFVKQHSAIDVFAALPVGLLAEILVYGKDYWLPKFRGEKTCEDR